MLSKIFSLQFPCSYGKRAKDPDCEKADMPLFCHLSAAFLGEAQTVWTSMSAVWNGQLEWMIRVAVVDTAAGT